MINKTLNSGHQIPQLGLGTFDIPKNKCESVVSQAIEIGYRHIDTATVYENEHFIGNAILSSGIPRSEFFITTKFWGQRFDRAQLSLDLQKSLDMLKTDYLDLYLIHVPEEGYLDIWLAIEEIYNSGVVKSIGVSNFNIKELSYILENGNVVPAVNQIKIDPFFQQKEIQDFNKKFNICTQAWGPLGQGWFNPIIIPGINDMMKKYNKTGSQIVLRWHIQEGRIIFPKSSNARRLKENFSIFDFELNEKEIKMVGSVDDK